MKTKGTTKKQIVSRAVVGILVTLTLVFCAPIHAGDPGVLKATGVSPSNDPDSMVFVSRSGVTFSHYKTWVVHTQMKGRMEVVSLHPAKLGPDAASHNPKPSDYKPENFRSMQLIQLLIIPKGAPGGHKSLKEIRVAKEKDLEGQDADYSFVGRGLASAPDTFKVMMSEPHQYIQVYTQTPDYFLILTAGGGRKAWGAYALTVRTLHEYIAQFYPSTEAEPYNRWKPLDSFRYSDYPSFWNMYLGINCGFLVLTVFPWPKKVRGRFRIVGLSLLGFSNTMAVTAWLIAFIPYFLRIPTWHNGTHACAAIVLFMPWICRLVSDKLQGIRRGRVFWWSLGLSILLLAAVVPGFNDPSTYPKHILPIFGFSVSWILGLLYGICFGFTFLPAQNAKQKGMLNPMLFLIVFLIAEPSPADCKGTKSETQTLAEELFEKKGYSNDRYWHDEAIKELKENRMFYKFERVEVTGFLSRDDTHEIDPNLFAKQIKPSALSKIERGFFKWLFRKIRWRDYTFLVEDVYNTLMDMNGHLSPAGKESLKELRGVEINEIVAHSWGSELMLNAIIDGYIRPPKKLIVIGSPDPNQKKWAEFAEITGVDVELVLGSKDAVSRIVPKLKEKMAKYHNTQSLKDRWKLSKQRQWSGPGKFKTHNIPVPSHGRADYYKQLTEKGILQGSLTEMMQVSTRRIEGLASINRRYAWDNAIIEANKILEEAQRLKERMEEKRQMEIWEGYQREAAKEKIRRERSFECSPAFFLLDFSRKTCRTPGGADLAELHSALGTWFVNRSSKIDISCVDFDKNDPIGCPKEVFNKVLFYRNIWLGPLRTSDFSLNDVDDFLLKKINIYAPVKVEVIPVAPLYAASLARLAKKACAAPGSIGPSDLKYVNGWFPNPNLQDDVDRDFLSGCAEELYLQLLDINRRWSKGGWVVDLDRTRRTSKGRIIRYQWINSEARKIKERSKSTPYYPPSRGGGGNGGGGYPGPECMKTRCVDL